MVGDNRLGKLYFSVLWPIFLVSVRYNLADKEFLQPNVDIFGFVLSVLYLTKGGSGKNVSAT